MEGSKRKHFELVKIEYLILSAINIGVAGTSALSREERKKYPIYSSLYRISDRVRAKVALGWERLSSLFLAVPVGHYTP